MQFVKPRQKEKDGHLTGSVLKSQCGIPVELAGRSLVTLVSSSRRDTYLRIIKICMWSPKSKWAHPGSKWLVLDYTLEMNLKDVYPGNQLEICQLRTHRILRGKAFSYGGKVWHHWVRSQSKAKWRTGESKKSTGLDLGETQSWLQILVLLFTILTVPYPKSFMEKWESSNFPHMDAIGFEWENGNIHEDVVPEPLQIFSAVHYINICCTCMKCQAPRWPGSK